MKRYGKILEHTRSDQREAIIKDDVALIPLGVNAKDGYVTVDKRYAYLAEQKWRKSHHGYAIGSDKERMQRLITRCPSKMVVDHIDGDPLNNRLSNLRICTQSKNSKNQGIKTTNKTGYKGVCLHKATGLYRAVVKKNYKQYSAGYHKTAKEASKAYDKLAKQLHGEYARLNHG